jgi:hypothetical protein
LAINKRTIFLVNPTFQLSFSLMICSIIFISSLIYPFIIIDFFNSIAGRFPDVAGNLKLAQNELLLFLALIQFIFIFIVFITFIFMTHKVAGPMYKLKAHLSAIREGGPVAPLVFRNGDHFHDVAEEVTLFLETIADNQEKDFKYLEEIAIYIENLSPIVPDDKKPILNEISRRLLNIKSRYQRSV